MQNKNYIIEITLLIISFAYFFFWNKYCSSKVEFNNESIEFAINTFNFTPYVSYYLYLIVDYFFSKNLMSILGNVLIPSFVFLMIFKIFEKLLINKLWAISISLLSISSTENYPFINFFINFITEVTTLITSIYKILKFKVSNTIIFNTLFFNYILLFN